MEVFETIFLLLFHSKNFFITKFITKSFFFFLKEVRLNSTPYEIMMIHNKRELQQIAINCSADIDHEDLQEM